MSYFSWSKAPVFDHDFPFPLRFNESISHAYEDKKNGNAGQLYKGYENLFKVDAKDTKEKKFFDDSVHADALTSMLKKYVDELVDKGITIDTSTNVEAMNLDQEIEMRLTDFKKYKVVSNGFVSNMKVFFEKLLQELRGKNLKIIASIFKTEAEQKELDEIGVLTYIMAVSLFVLRSFRPLFPDDRVLKVLFKIPLPDACVHCMMVASVSVRDVTETVRLDAVVDQMYKFYNRADISIDLARTNSTALWDAVAGLDRLFLDLQSETKKELEDGQRKLKKTAEEKDTLAKELAEIKKKDDENQARIASLASEEKELRTDDDLADDGDEAGFVAEIAKLQQEIKEEKEALSLLHYSWEKGNEEIEELKHLKQLIVSSASGNQTEKDVVTAEIEFIVNQKINEIAALIKEKKDDFLALAESSTEMTGYIKEISDSSSKVAEALKVPLSGPLRLADATTTLATKEVVKPEVEKLSLKSKTIQDDIKRRMPFLLLIAFLNRRIENEDENDGELSNSVSDDVQNVQNLPEGQTSPNGTTVEVLATTPRPASRGNPTEYGTLTRFNSVRLNAPAGPLVRKRSHLQNAIFLFAQALQYVQSEKKIIEDESVLLTEKSKEKEKELVDLKVKLAKNQERRNQRKAENKEKLRVLADEKAKLEAEAEKEKAAIAEKTKKFETVSAVWREATVKIETESSEYAALVAKPDFEPKNAIFDAVEIPVRYDETRSETRSYLVLTVQDGTVIPMGYVAVGAPCFDHHGHHLQAFTSRMKDVVPLLVSLPIPRRGPEAVTQKKSRFRSLIPSFGKKNKSTA
jgi:hypothetical protein